MTVKQQIEEKLATRFAPAHLEVVDESHQHNVPEGSESHFKVVLVSDAFDGKSLVSRHRMVYDLLAAELQSRVHALALHTYSPADWQKSMAPASPRCLGGKANEPS
jgi:BolA protein